MKKILILVLLFSITLLSACAVDSNIPEPDGDNTVTPGDNGETQLPPTDNTQTENTNTPGDDTPVTDRWEGESVMNPETFNGALSVRLSSFETGTKDKQSFKIKYYAPYDDTYTFKTNSNTKVNLYSTTGKLISEIGYSETVSIEFFKDEVIYAEVEAKSSTKDAKVEVSLKDNVSLFPYDPQEMVDAEALLADSKKNETMTTAVANISYKKREGGLYINCNNPEQITNQCLHNGLTRNDVSNKSVFFTFEHNNSAATASSRIDGDFYYGYQVINRGTEDVYITVKNIGFHIDGPGCWLGEKEWIDFYNTKFVVKGFSSFTSAQLTTFNDYFGFSNNYADPDNQAITYRLPAGEYMYVMGGTSKDAYNNYNVFGTADYPVKVAGCSNGAVLFEVSGDNVEGVFYAYQDTNKISPENKTLQGYVTKYANDNHDYSNQYVGYDECHGVVDAHLTWEFNDTTTGGSMNNYTGNLLVNYTTRYDANVSSKNTPYQLLDNKDYKVNNAKYWITHINSQHHHDAVATDMTKYITVNQAGEEIVLDYEHLDGTGDVSNIGNWMIDYMEHYTFVNHGKRNRKVTVGFNNNGCVAVLVRDKNGKLIQGTEQYTIVQKASGSYAGLSDAFSYTVTVPAGGYVQFIVEYNLVANASGYVRHYAVLK